MIRPPNGYSGPRAPASRRTSDSRARWFVDGELFAPDRASGDRSLCREIEHAARLCALRGATRPDDLRHRRALARPRGGELPERQRAERGGRSRSADPREPHGGSAGEPGPPDASKETKVDTGYGSVGLTQKTVPEELVERREYRSLRNQPRDADGGVVARRRQANTQLVFYVYRAG